MPLYNPAHATILSHMPPSDFKDLIDAAIHLHIDSLRFLQENNCFSGPHNNNLHEPKDERCITERQATIARDLINRHDNLGRHYGWVLAGDHGCVDKALRGICEAGKRPSERFKDLSQELEKMRAMLKELQLSVRKTGVDLVHIQP